MFELMPYVYTAIFCIGALLCLGGAGFMIRSNQRRITKVEKKQDEDGDLLHEMNGKLDMVIKILNGDK